MSSRNLRPFAAWLWQKLEEHPEIGQNDLARAIGIQPGSLSTYLNDKALPSRRNLRKLAQFFEEDPMQIQLLVDASEEAVHRRFAEEPASYVATARPIEGYGPDELDDLARAMERVAEILRSLKNQEHSGTRRSA